MNMTILRHVRRILAPGLILSAGITGSYAEIKGLRIGGAGWFNQGRIGHSSIDTTGGLDLNGLGIVNYGAQVALNYTVSERMEVEAGVGSAAFHFVNGVPYREGGYAPMVVAPYVANANFTYSFWNEDDGALQFRGGLFPYDYAPDAQNLGLYLLRGPVYPGYLLSGFETKHVLPVANTLGAQFRHRIGGFTQDLLVALETELYPFYDISPAYLASFKAGDAFRIGGGVNFYHLLPIDDKITNDSVNIYVDTTGGKQDTVQLSFSGIKVGANFSFDPKALFGGIGAMGVEDLKLYGEVALIGLNNSAAYRQLYGDYKNRMPVMVGFNLPAFRILDRLAVEVEWYASKFEDNLGEFDHTAGNEISPIPFYRNNETNPNISKDDLKWSVYGSRVFLSHIKLSFQIANDHYRPGVFQGYGDNRPPDMMSVMQSGKDWYTMAKVAFFF